jgi:hypothetical protein
MEVMRKLWSDAGMEGVETRKIIVQRTFADFDDFWASSTGRRLRSRDHRNPVARAKWRTVKTRRAREAFGRRGRPHHPQRICQRDKGSRSQIIAEADVTADALKSLCCRSDRAIPHVVNMRNFLLEALQEKACLR